MGRPQATRETSNVKQAKNVVPSHCLHAPNDPQYQEKRCSRARSEKALLGELQDFQAILGLIPCPSCPRFFDYLDFLLWGVLGFLNVLWPCLHVSTVNEYSLFSLGLVVSTSGICRTFAKGWFPKGWFWQMSPCTEISSQKSFPQCYPGRRPIIKMIIMIIATFAGPFRSAVVPH